ncbi:Secoisolariciresinol dehydrogenase [Bienertia sinuspersici]
MASTSTFPLAVRRLADKVALITGGASGIGAHAAKHFAKHGAKVMIADVQDELGKTVSNNIGASLASYIHCDVTNEENVKNAVDVTVAQYGKLDIMYNNAGILFPLNPNILDIKQSEFKQVIEVNLIGSFLCTKHASRVMIPAEKGSIITTASISSITGGVAPILMLAQSMAL